MSTKSTVWSIVKDYINSQPVGRYILRQQLLYEVTLKYDKKFSSVTVDCIRNMATGLGYLQKTSQGGKYTIQEHFKEDLTMSAFRKDYDKMIGGGFKGLHC